MEFGLDLFNDEKAWWEPGIIGRELHSDSIDSSDDNTPRVSESSELYGPGLLCRADDRKHVFTMTLQSKIEVSLEAQQIDRNAVTGLNDVLIYYSLIIENLLPRTMYFKFALPRNTKNSMKVFLVMRA